MKTPEHIDDYLTKTINSINAIEKVKVSQFFKEKTMQRLFNEKEEQAFFMNWFTPRIQLTTLVCVLIINVYVVQKNLAQEYDESISNFATEYGLLTESNISLF